MADTYWQRRQRRSDERMAKRERAMEERVRRVYERQLRDLEREIADYYERYGVDGVLRYRDMLQTTDEADRRLLIENCEEFARQHPELADMVEIRKSIYKLDRLEGLRASVRYHLAQATAEATDGLDVHFAQDAADAMNAVAETMGYGSSFYSVDSEAVRQFVGTAWSDGKSYSDSIWEDARKVASYVERDLAKALVRGESYQRLCREMQRRFEGQSVSNIMRVIQTEGTYVARQAQGAEMRREGFEEYFIDPLGDKRTCEECRRLGRQSHETPFRFEDAEVGTNYPPIHPRCRCEVNPAVDDWEEWARRRRAEHRAQVAASEVSEEAVAKRFGGRSFSARSITNPADWYEGSKVEDVEEAQVFRSDGTPVEGLYFRGGRGRVTVSFPDDMDTSDLTVAHTHPDGGTFSTRYFDASGKESGDIYLLVRSGARANNAICDDVVYHIERTEGAQPEDFLLAAEEAEATFRNEALENALDAWFDEHGRPPFDDDMGEIEKMARKEVSAKLDGWYMENALRYGYNYSKKGR